MINEITEFTPKSINGIAIIGGMEVNIYATETTITATVSFPDSPTQFVSVALDNVSEKIAVSFSAEDTSGIISLIEDITAKLKSIKTELAV
jgi:hypothetical protein